MSQPFGQETIGAMLRKNKRVFLTEYDAAPPEKLARNPACRQAARRQKNPDRFGSAPLGRASLELRGLHAAT